MTKTRSNPANVVTQSDIDAAAKGLRMLSMSLNELDDLIDEFADKPAFAARAVYSAARQMRASKLRMGAKRNPRKRKAKTAPSQTTGLAPDARLKRRRAKPRVKGYFANPAGARVVYNRLLGGWYIVIGPHQSPISGRFDSKEAAQQSLIDAKAARGARGPVYRARNPAQPMYKVLARRKPSAPFELVGNFKKKDNAMQYARALHQASPTPIAVKVTT